jgi:glutathione peroxidase
MFARIAFTAVLAFFSGIAAADCPEFLNHSFKKLRSHDSVNLCRLAAGKPLLIVNTASHCGYTPQFKGLEALHQTYSPRGLVVVGFPSDDFHQEAQNAEETAEVCFVNYGVTFTMLAASPVRGAAANAVFKELNRRTVEPSWNFNKYLVSADGKSIQHFDSTVTPESDALKKAIEAALTR